MTRNEQWPLEGYCESWLSLPKSSCLGSFHPEHNGVNNGFTMGPTTPSQSRENPWKGHGPADVLQPGEGDSLSNTSTIPQRHFGFSSKEVLVLDNSASASLNPFTALSLNLGPKFSYSSGHQQQIEQNPPNSFKLKHVLRCYFSFKLIFCFTGSYQRAPKALPRSMCFPASSAGCRDQHQLLCQFILFCFLSF